MTLVVLAAGMGSRYGGMKQADPITSHGEFIIDFSVFDAIRAGYDKVVFIIKPTMYDTFQETIACRLKDKISIEYAYQTMDLFLPADYNRPFDRVKPYGTAHALLAAKKAVGDDNFAVINADDYYGVHAYKVVKDYMDIADQEEGFAQFCMAGYYLGNTLTEHGTVSRGICQYDKDTFLSSITERTKIRHAASHQSAEYLDQDVWMPLAYDSVASMNFFGFTPAIFDHIERGFVDFLHNPSTDRMTGEYYLPKAVDEMLQENSCQVKILATPDRWFGVTYHEDKDFVVSNIRDLIEKGIYPDGLWK